MCISLAVEVFVIVIGVFNCFRFFFFPGEVLKLLGTGVLTVANLKKFLGLHPGKVLSFCLGDTTRPSRINIFLVLPAL